MTAADDASTAAAGRVFSVTELPAPWATVWVPVKAQTLFSGAQEAEPGCLDVYVRLSVTAMAFARSGPKPLLVS